MPSKQKKFCSEAGLNLLRPDSGCPLRAGTGHGRPGRAPGRCGCAVTSLLQRGCGGAVCCRQDVCLAAIQLSCERDVAGGSLWRDGRWRGRAPGAALPSACGFPAVSIICRNGHCEMLSSGAHCPMTVPRVLVRRTASPDHADFGGLSSLDALVVVRLVVVPLPPRSPRRRWRVGLFGLIFCWT